MEGYKVAPLVGSVDNMQSACQSSSATSSGILVSKNKTGFEQLSTLSIEIKAIGPHKVINLPQCTLFLQGSLSFHSLSHRMEG